MTEEITEAIRNAFNEYLNAVDKIILENQALQIELQHLKQENEKLKDANKSLSILGTDLASANEVVRKEFFRADKNKDMWRECAENYRSALEEIKKFLDNSLMVTNVGTKQMIYYADFFEFKNDLKEKIDEVLNENDKTTVDVGFWDENGVYKENYQEVDSKEL